MPSPSPRAALARGDVEALVAVDPGHSFAKPAVLGWDCVRLIVTRDGWKTRLRLRGDHARRTARLGRRDEPLKD